MGHVLDGEPLPNIFLKRCGTIEERVWIGQKRAQLTGKRVDISRRNKRHADIIDDLGDAAGICLVIRGMRAAAASSTI